MTQLDPKAVAAANEKLWKNNPELRGRQLTMGPEDTAHRKEWMEHYREAAEQTPKPPPPETLPKPVSEPPPPAVASDACVVCGAIAGMTHEEKMEESIKRANLGPEVMEELGDIKTLVATMVIVVGILVAIAFTGYGALAEAIAAGLLIIGAAVSGVQIGEGINSMVDFYQKTRCDRATTPEDLDAAGKSFGDGIAKMGVGGLNLLLSVVGGRKVPARGKKPPAKAPAKPSSKPSVEPHPDGYKATWPDTPDAAIFFSVDDGAVNVPGIWRGGQPKGSAGAMLADSIKGAGELQPKSIKFSSIENPPTVHALGKGSPPGETVLGKTAADAATSLGGKVTSWKTGTDPKTGKPFLEAIIAYP